MAQKSGIFKIWLVGRASPSKFNYACYGDGPMYAIGTRLVSLFNQVCQHANSTVAACDYSWEMGNVGPIDVVVYCSYAKDRGIIHRKGGSPVHDSASGGTLAHSDGMITEIYLEALDGAANFATVTANLIFHEIMHNKIDAAGTGSVADIHVSGGGGLANAIVSAGSALTPGNISLMASSLGKEVKQYTAEMQKPLLN